MVTRVFCFIKFEILEVIELCFPDTTVFLSQLLPSLQGVSGVKL